MWNWNLALPFSFIFFFFFYFLPEWIKRHHITYMFNTEDNGSVSGEKERQHFVTRPSQAILTNAIPFHIGLASVSQQGFLSRLQNPKDFCSPPRITAFYVPHTASSIAETHPQQEPCESLCVSASAVQSLSSIASSFFSPSSSSSSSSLPSSRLSHLPKQVCFTTN